MPTYEYECPKCGTRFEKFEAITARPAGVCPACGTAAKRRISAGAGLIFKGSGFYTTDYRSESYKKDAAKDREPVASCRDAASSCACSSANDD